MRFVLIHGGWQGGWCWDGVRDALRGAGHEVLVPGWLGSPGDGPTDPETAAVSRAGDAVVRQIIEADLDEFVLVGHSGGGPVGQHVADRLLPRVRRLIFVNAWVLHDGEAIGDVVAGVAAFKPVAESRADRSVPIPPQRWRERLMNGAPDDLIASTERLLVPLPFVHFEEPIALPRLWQADLPTGYVFLRDDLSVDPAMYRRMADRLAHPRVVHCEGPHEAMLTHPTQLAQALLDAAAPSSVPSRGSDPQK